MSKLIVIDGLDGSGKATQASILENNLKNMGFKTKKISFPNYANKSSDLVKYYLEGNISKNPSDVNAYAAASFYACDRYISYLTDWKQHLNDNTIIIADRYVSSNAIHQMVKLKKNEWDVFLEWIFDYEYKKLSLPKEDFLIYLDMDPLISSELIFKRYNCDNNKKDIHEQDLNYLIRCREAALYSANKYKWDVVACDSGGKPFPVNEISDIILEKVSVKVNL